MTGRRVNYFSLVVVALLSVITTSAVLGLSRNEPHQALEISLVPKQELSGNVYIGGAVVNPGFYPWKPGDRLEAIIRAAGGATEDADLDGLRLYIPRAGVEKQPQKVDLNRAEGWLLQSLPGIGETRANAILEYRQRNGFFKNTAELLKVEGIGMSTFERIQDLITVSD